MAMYTAVSLSILLLNQNKSLEARTVHLAQNDPAQLDIQYSPGSVNDNSQSVSRSTSDENDSRPTDANGVEQSSDSVDATDSGVSSATQNDAPGESRATATNTENSEGVHITPLDEEADGQTAQLMERAREHFFQRRFHIALRLLHIVLERDPENLEAYRYAGDVHLMQNEFDAAREYYLIARDLSPEPEREWFRLGQLYFLKGDGDAAREAFEQALSINADLHQCYFYLGLVEYRLFRSKKKTIEYWETYRGFLEPESEQATRMDQALDVLRKKDYEIPESDDSETPCAEIPVTEDVRAPYSPGESETERINNSTMSIIELDDL